MSSSKFVTLYTGTKMWVGKPYIGPAVKGHVEHGPGIYFTTHLATARRYAGGARTVLRVEVDPNLTWLEDVKVPLSVLTDWVQNQPGLRKKKEILSDLRTRNPQGRVAALVNLMHYYGAITGDQGPALAEFLVRLGISASHVPASGTEEWVVLFDPAKVLSWRKVDANETEWELPRVKR